MNQPLTVGRIELSPERTAQHYRDVARSAMFEELFDMLDTLSQYDLTLSSHDWARLTSLLARARSLR